MGNCNCECVKDKKKGNFQEPDILAPVSPRTRKNEQQLLMSSLLEDFKDEQFTHLFSSNIDLDQFEVVKVIGRGTFAKVYLVKKFYKDTGETKHFAMKVIKKKQLYEKDQMHHTLQERKIYMETKHPFLVELHYAFQSPDRIYFVLDFINGGDLFYHLKKKQHFNEQDARFYICEIILALEYLHQKGFIYRDLKPENILLDSEGHVRITDFGLSRQLGNGPNDQAKTLCGTAHYLAPEVILHKGYNKMADWWTVGILLYELVVGSPPFNDRSQKRVMNDILTREFQPREYMSKNIKKLLYGLLEKNPKKRLGHPSYGGVQSIKNHEFFTGIEWSKVVKKEYKPPVKPNVKDGADTKNIDKIYLKQEIKNTPDGSFSYSLLNKMNFDNFTYSETASIGNMSFKEEGSIIEMRQSDSFK